MLWKGKNFFIDIKQYFGKIKRLVINRKGNLCTKINIKQISKKHYLIIKGQFVTASLNSRLS